ncbi:MAG TPA: hypothetical protein VK204_16665 [Nocardioidaceae bacterium]|jgi:uncharacterized protein YcfL|nr:hypothetical protein [Nocardioidaceae bacterium]
MRRALALVAVATLALSGCASSEEPEPAAKDTPAASASATSDPASSAAPSPSEDSGNTIEIKIQGDDVEPSGERVQAKVGEPITLHISSDRDAELHVHSSPEQELEVKPGESTKTLTIDTPGIVEVEEHHTETVMLQLEVR